MVDVQIIWRAWCAALLVLATPGCFSSPTPHPAQDAGIAMPPDPNEADARDQGNDFGEACGVDGGPADGCDPGEVTTDAQVHDASDVANEADGAEGADEVDAGPEP